MAWFPFFLVGSFAFYIKYTAAFRGTIWNILRCLRVAAPSIRFVPYVALASCWPLPQQLLPVSATGGGRRRCWIFLAELDF